MQYFILLILFFYSSMMPEIAKYMLQEMAVQVSDEVVKQEFLMSQTTALPRGGLASRCWRTISVGANQPQPSSVSGLSVVQQNYLDFSRLYLDSPERPGRENVCAYVWRSDQALPAAQAHHTSAHAQPHMVTPPHRGPHHASSHAEAEFCEVILALPRDTKRTGEFRGWGRVSVVLGKGSGWQRWKRGDCSELRSF